MALTYQPVKFIDSYGNIVGHFGGLHYPPYTGDTVMLGDKEYVAYKTVHNLNGEKYDNFDNLTVYVYVRKKGSLVDYLRFLFGKNVS